MQDLTKPLRKQIDAAFDAFDSDKGGSISAVEIKQILSRCGVESSASMCEFIVKKYAKNDNKDEITKEGFNTFINELYGFADAQLKNFATDVGKVILTDVVLTGGAILNIAENANGNSSQQGINLGALIGGGAGSDLASQNNLGNSQLPEVKIAENKHVDNKKE